MGWGLGGGGVIALSCIWGGGRSCVECLCGENKGHKKEEEREKEVLRLGSGGGVGFWVELLGSFPNPQP
jgi:hypothetical protein